MGEKEWDLVDKKNVNRQGHHLVELPNLLWDLNDIVSYHWGVVLTVLLFNIAMLRPHTVVAVFMSVAVRGQSLIMFNCNAQVMSESDGNAKPAWRLQT